MSADPHFTSSLITATAVGLRLWCLFAFACNELTASLWRVDRVTSWLASEILQILSADLMGKMWMCHQWSYAYCLPSFSVSPSAVTCRHLTTSAASLVTARSPCPVHLTASRSERRRPADCLQSCSGVEDSRLMYASPAWRGFVTATDLKRVDAFLRHCKRCGYCSSDLPVSEELLDESDDRLFSKTLNNSTHTLHTLLPPLSSASQYYHLRRRTHDRQLPTLNSHMCIKKLRYMIAVQRLLLNFYSNT